MYQEMKTGGTGRNRMIDLRSDTVTQPSFGMRKAMAEAEVGDDVYGEDPTIMALEDRVASLLGKEAGLLMPTGTQSNLAALLTHCARGEEYIVGNEYHAFKYEAGGASVLGGIVPCALPLDENGGLDPADVEASIKPDDSHFAMTRLLSLENTVSGQVQQLDHIDALCAIARKYGLATHLDGARIWNAATALGVDLETVAKPFDTISSCLSKGLGTPACSILSGPRDFIDKARRLRKMLGGGMRQAGILAACGLYALEHHFPRLGEDHENARALAKGLGGLDGLNVHVGDTNMLFLEPVDNDPAALVDHLAGQGILIGGAAPKIRCVLHMDVSNDDVGRVVEGVRSYYNDI